MCCCADSVATSPSLSPGPWVHGELSVSLWYCSSAPIGPVSLLTPTSTTTELSCSFCCWRLGCCMSFAGASRLLAAWGRTRFEKHSRRPPLQRNRLRNNLQKNQEIMWEKCLCVTVQLRTSRRGRARAIGTREKRMPQIANNADLPALCGLSPLCARCP